MLTAAVLQFSFVGEGHAQSCSFTIQNVDFGSANVAFNTYINTVVRLKATCTGSANQSVRVCANLGPGSGGMDATGSPRYLASGSNLLAYDVYSDSYSTIWGSGLDSAPSSYFEKFVALNSSGNGRAVIPIRLRIRFAQQNAPTGTYTSSFAGSDSRINYGYTFQGTCASFVSANTRPVEVPFTATAKVSANCNVIDYPLIDFGTQPAQLSGPLDSSGTFRVWCNSGLPYSIALDGGNAEATDPTQRQMYLASNTTGLFYGLYSDAAFTKPWGSTAGVDTVTGVGAAPTIQTYRVYVRIPQQQIPVAGFYQDAVAITLTY